MYIFIGLTYALASIHIILALLSIILGIISQSREPIWMAHSISPLWSGVFVRIYFCFLFIYLPFVLVCTNGCHRDNICTSKRSLCGKLNYELILKDIHFFFVVPIDIMLCSNQYCNTHGRLC